LIPLIPFTSIEQSDTDEEVRLGSPLCQYRPGPFQGRRYRSLVRHRLSSSRKRGAPTRDLRGAGSHPERVGLTRRYGERVAEPDSGLPAAQCFVIGVVSVMRAVLSRCRKSRRRAPCAYRKVRFGRTGDEARRPGHATRYGQPAEPGARPAHLCPMSGAFSRCCNRSHNISGLGANAARLMR